MKKTFFLLFTFFLSLASATAQRYFDIQSATTDTLINQDTVIYTTTTSGGPLNLDVPYYYSIHVIADSLSGADNAGYAYLQFSDQRGSSPTSWYTAQTMTINGTLNTEAYWSGIAYARKVRVYFITPSGTKKIRPYCYASFKRVY